MEYVADLKARYICELQTQFHRDITFQKLLPMYYVDINMHINLKR